MTSRFRLAIVGSGQIAAKAHVPAALESSRIAVTAVIDAVQPRAERLVREFGLQARAAAHIAEVREHIDGALIATPNNTHHSLALECLRLNLPVLIEKPLATTVAEGTAIVEAARDNEQVVAVGYCTRFWDSVELLGELLAKGYFGTVRRFVYQLGMTDWEPPLSRYSMHRGAAGGGVLMVNGSHFVDRMLCWFGMPDEWEYQDDSLGGPEANASIGLRWFRHRMLEGKLRMSKSFRLVNGLALDTESGVVIAAEDAAAPILLRPGQWPIQTTIERRPRGACQSALDAFRLQLEDFADACQQGRPPRVPGEDGLQSLQLIERLYAAGQPSADCSQQTVEEKPEESVR